MLEGVRLDTNWIPPTAPWIKINFDDVIFEDEEASGMGVIARDMDGQCLAWATRRVAGNLGAINIESCAACLAVKVAVLAGWSEVIFEGDCLPLIHDILCPKKCTGDHANVIKDTRRVLNAEKAFEFQ